jgi:hypothetical protein
LAALTADRYFGDGVGPPRWNFGDSALNSLSPASFFVDQGDNASHRITSVCGPPPWKSDIRLMSDLT